MARLAAVHCRCGHPACRWHVLDRSLCSVWGSDVRELTVVLTNLVSCGATVKGYAHWVVWIHYVQVWWLVSLSAEGMGTWAWSGVVSVTDWFICPDLLPDSGDHQICRRFVWLWLYTVLQGNYIHSGSALYRVCCLVCIVDKTWLGGWVAGWCVPLVWGTASRFTIAFNSGAHNPGAVSCTYFVK